jgi:hypothetical protein
MAELCCGRRQDSVGYAGLVGSCLETTAISQRYVFLVFFGGVASCPRTSQLYQRKLKWLGVIFSPWWWMSWYTAPVTEAGVMSFNFLQPSCFLIIPRPSSCRTVHVPWNGYSVLVRMSRLSYVSFITLCDTLKYFILYKFICWF